MEPDDRPIRFPFLDTLDRPEIEDDFGSAHYLRYRSSLQSTRTSVDVLDLKGSLRSDIQWRQNLDHDALLSHFGVDDEACNSAENSVRVLFLSARIVDEDGTLPANYSRRLRGKNSTVAASAATLEWLCIRFGVSLLFLDCIIRISWGIKPGNACFTQRNESGNIERVDALYHIFQYNMPCRVWFTYSTESRITTYIIFNCAFEAKSSILNLALSSNHQKLRRAAVVDAIIINAGAWELKKDAQYNRGVLLDYEMAGAAAAQIPSNESLSAFQRLHDLSQAWHVLTENLRDQLEVMEFISAFHRKHVPSYGMSLKHSAHESIEFLISQHHIWLRWVANYNVRTQIRINLGFNMASQSDNRINIKIADTSTKIAEAARKDSSSMITIAALTMLFLPGTFVSAIFSMTFFNAGVDASGKATLSVLPEWWYFPVATIPLTVLVFICWIFWQRQRAKLDIRSAASTPAGQGDYNEKSRNWSVDIVSNLRRRFTHEARGINDKRQPETGHVSFDDDQK